jgi:predicted Zn-dependent peptidase
MKKISSILFLAGLSSVAMAQERKIDFTEYDLSNGMHVILHKDNSTPIVAVSIMYHVGSKNENPERTGFAHFFEHLMFEGSVNIGRGEYSKMVEKNGGALNANTSQDRTYYYEILPSNQLELGLWLESERLYHANVDSTGIETQREVVKEEKRQRMDNQPYGSFMANAFSLMFKTHPYRWIPIGSMDDLNAATDEDYVGFYHSFYVPNNATLSIAGDIDIETTKKLIEKYYASIPAGEKLNVIRDMERLSPEEFVKIHKGQDAKTIEMALKTMTPEQVVTKYYKTVSSKPIPIVQPTVIEPPLSGVIVDTIYDNIQLPALFVCYRMPAENSKDFYAVQMLNEVMSGSKSSRFNKSIVEKQQLAMALMSFPFPLEDPGMAVVLGLANAGIELKTIQDAMDKEIEKLQTELISDDEYTKIQNSFENSFYTDNSTMAGIAEALANNYVYFGNTNLINSEIDKYKAVSKEDIRNAAKKYFTADKRVILYYLPKKEDDKK